MIMPQRAIKILSRTCFSDVDADDDEGSDGFEESRGEVAFLVVT